MKSIGGRVLVRKGASGQIIHYPFYDIDQSVKLLFAKDFHHMTLEEYYLYKQLHRFVKEHEPDSKDVSNKSVSTFVFKVTGPKQGLVRACLYQDTNRKCLYFIFGRETDGNEHDRSKPDQYYRYKMTFMAKVVWEQSQNEQEQAISDPESTSMALLNWIVKSSPLRASKKRSKRKIITSYETSSTNSSASAPVLPEAKPKPTVTYEDLTYALDAAQLANRVSNIGKLVNGKEIKNDLKNDPVDSIEFESEQTLFSKHGWALLTCTFKEKLPKRADEDVKTFKTNKKDHNDAKKLIGSYLHMLRQCLAVDYGIKTLRSMC